MNFRFRVGDFVYYNNDVRTKGIVIRIVRTDICVHWFTQDSYKKEMWYHMKEPAIKMMVAG